MKPKIHYAAYPGERSPCGRVFTDPARTTSDPHLVTCERCYGSPQLDGMLGSMTHTGH